MTRISETFAALRSRGEVALIPYITAGDPDLATTFHLVHELARQGADLIELGVPFSDPMADGPTHQRAAERALRSGTSIARVLDLAQNLRRTQTVPLILFTYYNLVFRYGGERFACDARQAGVTGARATLPPDLSEMVRRIRAISPVPVGVGFGISSPEQAAEVASVADAVIVGSALSQIIETHGGQPDLVERIGVFAGSLKQGIRNRNRQLVTSSLPE